MGQHLKAKLYNLNGFPKMLTPKEAAAECNISEERLMYLAKEGFAPCVVVDEGTYLFFKKDLMDWVKDNLLRIQEGKKIEINLSVISPKPPEYFNIPESLIPISKRLKTIDLTSSGPVVYFLIKDGEVVYVGQSVSLLGRINQHLAEKDFDKVMFMPIPGESLVEVEESLIKHLRPKLNKAQNTAPLDDWYKKSLVRIGMIEKEA